MKRVKRYLGSAAVLAVMALLLVYRGALVDWFFAGKVGEGDGRHAPAHAGADAGAQKLFRFSQSGLQTLQLAFGSYEQLRDELARDSLERVSELGTALAQTAREVAKTEPDLPAPLRAALEGAASGAEKLAKEGDIAQARTLFGEVSEGMVAVALEDPRVADGWSLFECPMARGYKRWLQPDAEMKNPYMGTRMLKCGSTLNLAAEAEAQQAAKSVGDPNEVAHWTCPMHPGVKQAHKGVCPICGMDLVPVTQGDLATGVVTVDEVRRQKIGVKIDEVKKAPFVVTVRTVGEVKYDETKLEDVTLKVRGWIRGLKVDTTGEPVKKGQVLFGLYSPELFSAQQEFLLALRTRNGDLEDPLVRAARQRLRLWDVTDEQLQLIAQRGEPLEALPIRAPASGYIIEKNVVEGAAVEPGMRLYRIAALDRVWIEAQVYESELPFVKVGMPVEVSLPFVPGRSFDGKVSYVYPYLQENTRTGLVRIALPNPDGLLKPKMYADVTFRIDRGERLQVPAPAVIYTGPRRLVFVDLGEGRLRPREVTLGLRSGNAWEVLEGLTEGERVVTSGNFLIAAESRLRSATEYWGGEVSDDAR